VHAAQLKSDRPCYRVGTSMHFTGGGFTPNGSVSASLLGKEVGRASVDPAGSMSAKLDAPSIATLVRKATLTVTDEQNPAIHATVDFRITRLLVTISPRNGSKPNRRVTFHVRGFDTGRAVYVHYLTPHGSIGKTVRLARARGVCGTASAQGDLIPYGPAASPGRWGLRFDTRKKYSRKTRPQVRLEVKVRPR
jgi:hypothetical protein